LAEVLERKYRVVRLDLQPVEVQAPVRVMHICFTFASPTKFHNAVQSYIRRFQPELTIINSTVPPGTTRALAKATGAAIAYSPVRGKHARMPQELLCYTKFISGLNEKTIQLAQEHFSAAGMKTRLVSKPESLELAKLAETTYFGVIIAFAQELNRWADAAEAYYDDVTTFFEEVAFLPRAKYFPGFIGGHCVIPNIDLLLQLASSDLLEAVLKSNDLRAAELGVESDAGRRRVIGGT
jgi:UDP-N-acetyl-D-mannosaminuronate dehydrogenase